MKSLFLIGFTGTLLSAAGYAHAAGREHPQIRLKPANECPVAQGKKAESAALAGVLVPLVANVAGRLLGAGFDRLAAYLGTNRSVTLKTTFAADGFAYTSTSGTAVNQQLGCIIVMVAPSAAFSKATGNPTALQAWFTEVVHRKSPYAPTDKGSVDTFSSRTGLYDQPLVYAEMTVRFDTHVNRAPSAIGFVTRTFSYADFVGPTGFLGSSKRDFNLTLGVSSPGEDKPFLFKTIQRESVRVKDIDDAAIEDDFSWLPFPAAVFKAPPDVKGTEVYSPVNVTATFVETVHPNTLSLALAGAITDEKKAATDALSKEVTEALSEQAAAQAKLGQVAAQQELLTTAHTMRVAYQSDQSALEDAQKKYAAATGNDKIAAKGDVDEATRKRDLSRMAAETAWNAAGLGAFPAAP